MSGVDADAWLDKLFSELDKAKPKHKRERDNHEPRVLYVKLPEAVTLSFQHWVSETVMNPRTGRVAGSERRVDVYEDIVIPEGTAVRIYRRPKNATRGVSIANFLFPDNREFTYKRDTNISKSRL